MEGFSRKAEIRPQLQDFTPKGRREWLVNQNESRNSEEKKLELRLGPPGEEDWAINKNNFGERDDSSLLSLGFFSNMAAQNTCGSSSPWLSSHHHQSLLPVMGKESLQQTSCTTKVGVDLQSAEKKAFSLASANNTAVPNTSQKRTAPAPAPVVGWPPIRSFRKNLASSSSSSKLSSEAEPQKLVPKKISNERQVERCPKGLFVKINMEGVPIGRKVDLKSYDSYEKLSCAVDELFRDLLAAQRDPNSAGKIQNNQEGEKAITGLLDGGEYTLVYEDNEGDRMLVGDVPWHMFVSTIKRLRVLKSSELPSLFLGSKQEKNPTIL